MATTSSPFTKTVTSAMRKLYPEHLADKSFDNTGLLLEAPENKSANLRNSVLLTIDLTKAVAQEAIEKKCGVVVAYRAVVNGAHLGTVRIEGLTTPADPIIFRPLKALTFGNTQQSSLLRLAAEGISLYCPHTAVDAAVGGNADWLADMVVTRWYEGDPRFEHDENEPAYNGYSFPRLIEAGSSPNKVQHERSPIVPSTSTSIPEAGMGRLVTLQTPENAWAILRRLTRNLGDPKSVNVAVPQTRWIKELLVTKIAVCAGSGSSVLGQAGDAEMLVTGEMSHHEVLAATENGKVVVCLGHSNSERHYLMGGLRPQLMEALGRESGLEGQEPAVEVSNADRDPFLSYT